MTIDFKIGSFYRTRGRKKVYLYGIRQNGDLHFEHHGDTFSTHCTGDRYLSPSPNDYDIVAEWREPHRNETLVWVREGSPTCTGVPTHLLNLPVQEWTIKPVHGDDKWRKFRVVCEEILE